MSRWRAGPRRCVSGGFADRPDRRVTVLYPETQADDDCIVHGGKEYLGSGGRFVGEATWLPGSVGPRWCLPPSRRIRSSSINSRAAGPPGTPSAFPDSARGQSAGGVLTDIVQAMSSYSSRFDYDLVRLYGDVGARSRASRPYEYGEDSPADSYDGYAAPFYGYYGCLGPYFMSWVCGPGYNRIASRCTRRRGALAIRVWHRLRVWLGLGVRVSFQLFQGRFASEVGAARSFPAVHSWAARRSGSVAAARCSRRTMVRRGSWLTRT